MDKRHPVPRGVSVGGEVDVTGLIKRRGTSEYAPLTRQKVCRVELEVNEIDITIMAYDELADRLAEFSTAAVLRVKGRLHIAKWSTGDGTIHQRMGVSVNEIKT